MAISTTGPLSMGDINVELGRTRTASISLDAAENGSYATINQNSSSKPSSSNPATISEWRGYNHTAASSGGGSGGGGTVNTGYILNSTGRTIDAAFMSIKANGTIVAYNDFPSLADGQIYQFNTSYTNLLFSNGTFILDLTTPTIGLTTSNYIYMTGGSTSTSGYFNNNGTVFSATVTSSGPQYAINITIK
ncbi:hypothetical protein [uncultured Flavobacterium sp.]|uniref:hypothetical protein n=1 Tax=uncultured Flavobacterium sp. TaxID=165435 RepID=UPI0025D713F8|nr:hypothetical protein [uncultured Flavobacterium sp.]